MGGEVVALVSFGDEGAEFDVLDGDFLAADVVVEDGAQFLTGGTVLLGESEELFHLLLIELLLETVEHAIERHFCSVGHIAEHGVLKIAFDGFVDLWGELFAQCLAFAVDVAVAASTEVDAFEGAGMVALRGKNLGEGDIAILVDGECLSGQEFVNAIGGHIECGLNDRTLGCHHQHLFVTIPESGTDAPGVSHGEHLAAAREAAQHIAAIEKGSGSAQDVGDVEVVFDVSCQVSACKSLHVGNVVDALALAVKTVPHQFEHDVGVVVDAGMLPVGSDFIEHLIHIGEIEVATKTEVLGSPVVAAHERVDMRESALACGGVAEMSHQDLSILPASSPFRLPLGALAGVGGGDGLENFVDGTASKGTFAEHIFLAWLCLEIGAGDARSFLSSIVLLLHEEIELVESVGSGSVFFLVVTDGFEQANHRHATFMFERLHFL